MILIVRCPVCGWRSLLAESYLAVLFDARSPIPISVGAARSLSFNLLPDGVTTIVPLGHPLEHRDLASLGVTLAQVRAEGRLVRAKLAVCLTCGRLRYSYSQVPDWLRWLQGRAASRALTHARSESVRAASSACVCGSTAFKARASYKRVRCGQCGRATARLGPHARS